MKSTIFLTIPERKRRKNNRCAKKPPASYLTPGGFSFISFVSGTPAPKRRCFLSEHKIFFTQLLCSARDAAQFVSGFRVAAGKFLHQTALLEAKLVVERKIICEKEPRIFHHAQIAQHLEMFADVLDRRIINIWRPENRFAQNTALRRKLQRRRTDGFQTDSR